MDIILTPINHTNVHQLTQLHKKVLPVVYADTFYSSLLSGDDLAIGAILPNGELVGAVTAYLVFNSNYCIMQDCTQGYISTLAISPNYQRKGLGSFLMKEIVKRLEKNGTDKIVLNVLVSNDPAIKLYKKHHFVIEKKLKDFYEINSKPFDAYQMGRQVQKHSNVDHLNSFYYFFISILRSFTFWKRCFGYERRRTGLSEIV